MDFAKYAPLITVTGTLAGVLIGAWLTRKNAFKLLIRQEFIKASALLKYILEEDVERLKTLPADEKFFIGMEKRFDSYEKAMIGLKINLPNGKVRSFEQAWDEYKYAGQDKQYARFHSLSTHHTVNGEEKAKERTLENIKKLVKFCDPDYVFK